MDLRAIRTYDRVVCETERKLYDAASKDHIAYYEAYEHLIDINDAFNIVLINAEIEVAQCFSTLDGD